MDDPKVIAGKYAKEVNEAIDGAARVATDAYDKINADPPAYETKDAIKSLFDLTRIAIQGAADIARIPLQTTPDPRVLLLADHITTVCVVASLKPLRSPPKRQISSTTIQRTSTGTNW
jgi:hypothetical protein